MSIPTQTEMFKIVLETMSVYPKFTRAQAKKIVSEKLGLSEQDKGLLTGSGVPVYESRISWAVSGLNEVDYLARVGRGLYSITETGRSILHHYPDPDAFLAQYRNDYREWVLLRNQQDISPSEEFTSGGSGPAGQDTEDLRMESGLEVFSPIERLDAAMTELQDQLAAELMNAIMRNEGRDGDTFFEKIVTDLLEKMGYGKGTVTQPSNDGGIDGIIKTDPLGFNPILIQAKRYRMENTVGRPEIQRFAGALGAVTRGAFITTSRFSSAAVDFAKNYPHADIVLIDGKKLTELMIQYNVGVSTEREIFVKRIDNDYFEL